MKTLSLAALAALALGGAASADEPTAISAPALKVGDSWVMEQTTQKGPSGFSRRRFDMSVERLNSDTMLLAERPDGAQTNPQEQILGLDWSRRLVVDGEQKVTTRPLSFPMRVGQSWNADWTDSRRLGNRLSAHVKGTYKVVGWEDVTVPAGTFHCLKIEENGMADAEVVIPSVAQSTAAGEPGAGAAVSRVQRGGRGVQHITLVSLIYYAPEMKRAVKVVDEQYDTSGVMTQRIIEEVVSFKPAG